MQYAGRFPQSSTTTLQLRQWEPQMTRSMTLMPTESETPKIPWDDFNLVATDSGRKELRSKLNSLRTPETEVDAVVLHGEQLIPLFPEIGFLFTRSATQLTQSRWWVKPWQHNQGAHPESELLPVGILEASMRNDGRDFFSIVSQVSPHGAASLEDLPMLDPSDDNQWLLMVAVKKQLKTKIFRRLFLQDEEQVRASFRSLPQ